MVDLQNISKHLEPIESQIKYRFKNKTLLLTAFVHSSFINESDGELKQSNERLEFLGDAVFGLIIGEYLYSRYPEKPEGELSYCRSRLIEASSCAKYLEKLQLQQFLLLSKGERRGFEAKPNPSILADLFEALIGAIYLDGGFEVAQKFVFEFLEEEIQLLLEAPLRNWKAELQDYSQRKYQKVPVYKVVREEGPDHSKVFHVSVLIDEKEMGQGHGNSKKIAQQSAAAEALCRLNLIDPSEISQ